MNYNKTIEILNKYADLITAEYKQKMKDGNSVASKSLIDSISTRINTRGKIYEVVLSLNDYWYYIENGRSFPKKAPPITAITEWIKVKHITPMPIDGGKVPTEKQLAFLIARKIGREGFKDQPKPYLSDTLDTFYDDFIKELSSALKEDVTSMVQFEIKNFNN